MFHYEEWEIRPNDAAAVAQLEALLRREEIARDKNLEYTLGIYDGDALIATGSFYKNTLRCLAVDASYRGEGLLNRVVSRLVNLLAQRGVYELFVYTKCDKAPFFKDFGFFEVCRVEGLVAFLENRRDGFAGYLERISAHRAAGRQAAVVINANPFTLGHRYLVEKAAAENDAVHLFVVTEDASLIPFDLRWRLVQEGVAHLSNVMLHQTGSYMISSATFPSYFIRESDDVILAQARLDIEIFKRIAGALGVEARYVGSEPLSRVTSAYNAVMLEELKKAGIRCVVVSRKEQDGRAISASAVRELIRLGRIEDIRPLVPDSTYRFFTSEQGDKIAARIRQAADVIHY